MAPDPGPAHIPPACTLAADDARDRIERWRRVLGELVAGAERPSGRELRLVLVDEPGGVSELIELARAESRCCAFFGFSLAIAADDVRLVIEVPAGSEAILDDFARLAPAPAP